MLVPHQNIFFNYLNLHKINVQYKCFIMYGHPWKLCSKHLIVLLLENIKLFYILRIFVVVVVCLSIEMLVDSNILKLMTSRLRLPANLCIILIWISFENPSIWYITLVNQKNSFRVPDEFWKNHTNFKFKFWHLKG